MIKLVVCFFLGVLVTTMGAYLGYLRWRQECFLRSGRAESVEGICVNLRWTRGGLVASGIRYIDKEGRQCVAWTRASSLIAVPVGQSAHVTYDPDGKASALVNGVADGVGSYKVAVGCFVVAAIFFFNVIRLI
ncbi:DUF3592 domain-containing protein [Streptomyces rhizosphaericola]|uniref:DUF3592 domain-containing protein n=1 Tax=Streptomyces rhizosphaericola TaxID=2564098 RepID=UPI0036C164CC